MSDHSYYTFFDRTAADPIWLLPLHDLLARFPKKDAYLSEVIRFGCEPSLGELTDEELRRKYGGKPLKWLLRRCDCPLFVMSEILSVAVQKGRALDIETGPLEDFFGLLGYATARFLAGELDRLTYEAILKLHNIERPSLWLRLSRRQAQRVDRTVAEEKMTRPIYRWQTQEGLQDSALGLWNYDVSNGLNVPDTTRFCTFMERSWKRNDPVENLGDDIGQGLSVDLSQGTPRFRDFHVNRKLVTAVRLVSKMERPVVMRYTT